MIWFDLLVALAPLSLIALFGWHLAKGLCTGSVYSAWTVRHRELHPFLYWCTVIGYAVIVVICAGVAAFVAANMGADLHS